MTERPDESTVVSIQGTELTEDGYEKRPATVSAYDREARPVFSHDFGERGRSSPRASARPTPAFWS